MPVKSIIKYLPIIIYSIAIIMVGIYLINVIHFQIRNHTFNLFNAFECLFGCGSLGALIYLLITTIQLPL